MHDLDSVASPDLSTEVSSSAPSLGHDSLEGVFEKIEHGISSEIKKVLDVFEKKLAYDSSKQLQIDRLHEELQKHKGDYLLLATRPLVLQIIQLYDAMGKLLSNLREKSDDEVSLKKFLTLLEGLQDDVEVILSQNGIAPYRGLSGSAFDSQRQRALQTIKTADQALADKIAETISPGFEQGNSILEKERVSTYEFIQEYDEFKCPEIDVTYAKED